MRGGADGDRVAHHAREEGRADDPEQRAERAADEPEDGGLHEELAPDDAGRGAEGLAEPDLADALGHRDQHDVHDPDAADQQ